MFETCFLFKRLPEKLGTIPDDEKKIRILMTELYVKHSKKILSILDSKAIIFALYNQLSSTEEGLQMKN